ncbi:MAG TPA: cytochrome C oxidase subunit I [Burkholderiales bacterium]|nr:cytochrome C oxidase subunit I [Burkholderiales bacterium]
MSNRLKLAGIFVACAAPFVLGWAAWYFGWGTGSRGNYGELIAPRVLSGPPFAELRGKWVLVSFDAAACDAACEKKLYFMRQLRKAQGKDEARIERLWIITDSGTPRPELLVAIAGTRVAGTIQANEAFPGNRRDHVYLVDPLGNLMLRFPRDPDPSRMLRDLQRLLKYSRIG